MGTKKVKNQAPKKPLSKRLQRDLQLFGGAYLLAIPVLAFYIIFHYVPMGGAIIAFKNFVPRLGMWKSPWAKANGMEHFISFFTSFYFGRTVTNTLTISLSSLAFGFPLPIIFALSINEIRSNKFKKVVQTVSYMPHFISLVVVCAMVRLFTDGDGFIVSIMEMFGYQNAGLNLLNQKSMFVPIYIISGIWQNMGWDCIIYLAALGGIDTELYEAAKVDGANRWKQTIHVTLPGLMSTIILLLILRIGSLMSVGYEKIILLYNQQTYETADVISSYVYRVGLVQGNWSFSTAVGLFNSVINFVLVVSANTLSNRFSGIGLW